MAEPTSRKQGIVHGQCRRQLRVPGLEVRKDSISVELHEPGALRPSYTIFHGELSIRRLLGRADPATLEVG